MRFVRHLGSAGLVVLSTGLFWSASAIAAIPTLEKINAITGDEALSNEGRAITPDGKYVAATVFNAGTGAATRGMFWSSTTNSLNVLASGRQATVASGIGYRTVTSGQEIVIAGLSSGFATAYGAPNPGAGAPVYSWSARDTVNYQTSPTTIAWPGSVGHTPATANSLAGTSGANWYQTFDHRSGGANVQLWTAKGGGDPTGAMVNNYGTKSTPFESHVRGVSSTGRTVGTRRDTSSSSAFQNYYWDYTYPTLAPQVKFKGLQAGTFNGEAWSVSGDGATIAGYAPVDGGRGGNWPYLYKVATDTITELPTLNSSIAGSGTNGIVYGLSSDGRYAVGMDFTLGLERAVLWDTLSMTELDLTTFATNAGILDGFTGNLRRAYAVGVNANGDPVITGRGFYTADAQYRGFVLTVPEPVSLLLLVVGALGLRRRVRH